MLLDHRRILGPSDGEVFDTCADHLALAKNLYNAALFRLRQTFCGWDKPNRTACEQEVFKELDVLRAAYPKMRIRRVLSYKALYRLMRVTQNPDFVAGLPSQSAEAILRLVCQMFSQWLVSLKDYRQNPGKYLARPRMPHYCRGKRHMYSITNQSAVLYPVKEDGQTAGSALKLPCISKRLRFPELDAGVNLREVRVCPYFGKIVLHLIIEDEAPAFYPDMPEKAAIDFGTDNLMALVCTDGTSVLWKGGAILAEDRQFAKTRGFLVGEITRGHEHMRASSHRLDDLSRYHDCFIRDQLHKLSTDVIRFCVQHRVGVLVLGVNKMWKQRASMSRVSNQKFVMIPHTRLRDMIVYKAAIAGIEIVLQEESYTSKADCTAKDKIPVYGKEKGKPSFSGKRVKRGLYRTGRGLLINADLNGAANILRKAFPYVWFDRKDFRFLGTPSVVNFKTLNRQKSFASA